MILVTGATGHLGAQVVKHLLERVPAQQVAVCVREPARAIGMAARGVTVRHGEFDLPESLPAAFADVERMLLISTNGPHTGRYRQHAAAIDAAARAGVGFLAYTSLLPTAPPSIGVLQQQTEHAIQASGIPYTLLRNSLYSENYTTTLTDALSTGVLLSATGVGRVATAARDDLALAAAAVLAGPIEHSATHHLTGPRAWNFDELAAITADLSGRPVHHRHVTPEELVAHRRAAGASDASSNIVLDIHRAIAAGAFETTTADLEQLIGRPPINIEHIVQTALGTTNHDPNDPTG